MQKFGERSFCYGLLKVRTQQTIAAPDDHRLQFAQSWHIEFYNAPFDPVNTSPREKTRSRNVCNFGSLPVDFRVDEDRSKQDAVAWQSPALK